MAIKSDQVKFDISPVNLKTGTYTGNGAASQAITGVGFQPKFVWIWIQTDSATYPAFYKSDQDGLNSMVFPAKTSAISYYGLDHIISLDVDGFTIGNTYNINLLGLTYVYVAIR